MDKKSQIIGHRGARGHSPENTLVSLKKGIELGCDYVEFDVRLTKDGIPIVIHDNKLNRTSNGTGRISHKTLAEIKKLRTKDEGQEIPTLEEVFKELKGKVKFMIEIKGTKPTQKVIELIKKYNISKDTIITSFKTKSLIEAKKILPEIKTALLWDITSRIRHKTHIRNKFKLAKKIGSCAIYPYKAYISHRFMRKAKKYGLEVYTYLGNESEIIRRLLTYGVDMIESDYPERVLKILNQK